MYQHFFDYILFPNENDRNVANLLTNKTELSINILIHGQVEIQIKSYMKPLEKRYWYFSDMLNLHKL